TQMSVWSRRASRQIAHVSSSVRLPHSLQKRTRSLTSLIAVDKASASSVGRWRRWNASLWAVRDPTPGRRESWATRFSTAGLSTVLLCRHASDCRGDASGRKLGETLGDARILREQPVDLGPGEREA